MITYQPKELKFEDWSGRQSDESKPVGLWYSPVVGVMPAWRQWCQGECWSPGTYTHQYRLNNLPYCSLKEAVAGEGNDKILLLSSEEEVWSFTWEFLGKNEYCIKWDKLASIGVAGIEVNPYQAGLRFCGARWYYPWDLASGCIWNMPEGMEITQMPLDWDGTVPSWED